MTEQLVTINQENGQPVVSSREVAEHFGKEHKNVIRAIQDLIGQSSKLSADQTAENSAVLKMFFESSYSAGTGKKYPMYLMNRDGFSLLVMGFTGKEALDWKIKYIQAFNEMEQQLNAERISAAASTIPDARMLEAQSRLMNSRTEQARLLLELADRACHDWDKARLCGSAVSVLGGGCIDTEFVQADPYHRGSRLYLTTKKVARQRK